MNPVSVIRSLLFTALLAASTGNAGAAPPKPDVAAALVTWEQTVESGNLRDIMNLYHKDAMMIPTFAQAPLTRRRQIEEYFRLIVSNSEIDVTVLESHPRSFGNMAINSGRYALSYTQDGEQVVIPARFTFVYTLDGGRWSIVEQHASRMPDAEEKK